MKKIYVNQFPNGSISYSSSLGSFIGPSSSEVPITTEIIVEDSIADDYFNNPNDYTIDIINKTVTKK